MKKILFISSSRADYGLLRNIILETKKNRKIKVFVLVTGSHLSKEFGNTIKEIEKVSDASEEDINLLGHLVYVSKKIAQDHNLDNNYRLTNVFKRLFR